MRYFTLNKLLILSGALALVLSFAFFRWWYKSEIFINNDGTAQIIGGEKLESPLSGIVCKNYNRRPVAVMLAGDPIARPLSGISRADIVFEMPVTPNGVTRLMAMYQREEPEEVGSIRSAREDFIPLAAGFGSVYVHWGGEREALKKLNGNIIDNIDALKYEEVYFYRKKGITMPHNGFVGFGKILDAISDFNYSESNLFGGYDHGVNKDTRNLASLVEVISIDYPFPFNVVWTYDSDKNIYWRSRGGEAEIDKNGGLQVEASVIIVMETTSSFQNQDYLTVNTTGEGTASFYQNGMKTSGRWKKDSSSLESKLFLYDNEGKEVEFAPGENLGRDNYKLKFETRNPKSETSHNL